VHWPDTGANAWAVRAAVSDRPRLCGAQEASENRAACQAALLKAGVLDILIGASLGDGAIASVTVRAQVCCLVRTLHVQRVTLTAVGSYFGAIRR